MKEQKFIIRNMTCSSCIKLIENELKRLGLKNFSVKLGEAKINNKSNISPEKIRKALQSQGFDLIENHEEQITENIRLAILELVNAPEGIENELKFTSYLEKKMRQPYKYISKIFSKHKKISIEKFLILAKIEKSKELIQYGELTFSEIANNLGYTNTQHLSGQFKKMVGCTMTDFRDKRAKKRISMNKF